MGFLRRDGKAAMKGGPLKLGLNIDHVATLRQARGGRAPDPLEAARIAELAGADGITVHLREDRRHIQDRDVRALRPLVRSLNLEMANTAPIAAIALEVRPDEVCIVPEKRQELTTEGGLDAASQVEALRATAQRMHAAGILVSLFIEPDSRQIEAAAAAGADFVELHTGGYATAESGEAMAGELERLIAGARHSHARGLRVNAGHGIDYVNIEGILRIPFLETLNIGHSIISRAVMVGLGEAVREMKRWLDGYQRAE